MTTAQLLRRTVALALGAVALWLIWCAWPQSLGGRVAYVRVDGWSMNPTLHNGDLVLVKRQPSYAVGDAVAYRIPRGEFGAGALVVHRLIGGDGRHGYVTRGDNRNINDPWHPRTSDVVGRVRYDVPNAGAAFATASKPIWIGALVALTTVFVMVLPAPKRGARGRRRAVHPNGSVRCEDIDSSTFPSSPAPDTPIHRITENSIQEKEVA